MTKIFLCLALLSVTIPSSSCSLLSKTPINTAGVSSLSREQKIWALAASAMLAENNKEPHVLLGRERTEGNIQANRRLLDQAWGIGGRRDLLETLDWIEQGGHRAEFDKLGSQINRMDEDQYQAVSTSAVK